MGGQVAADLIPRPARADELAGGLHNRGAAERALRQQRLAGGRGRRRRGKPVEQRVEAGRSPDMPAERGAAGAGRIEPLDG